MKKAMVFAAAFAASSALAQVGSLNGGSISDMGAGARYGAGPQIPATDMRASGQPAAAARPLRSGAGAGTAGPVGANSVGVSGTSAVPQASGSTPMVSGTTWGSAPASAAQANNAANRESEERRDVLEDGDQK